MATATALQAWGSPVDVPIWKGLDARTLACAKTASALLLKATFGGNPGKLVLFFNQVWTHFD